MPGIREPERMRKLLQGSANLEFWVTYNNTEINPYLQQLNARLASGDTKVDTTKTDTAKTQVAAAEKKQTPETKFQLKNENKETASAAAAKKTEAAQLAQAKKENPLLSMLQIIPNDALALVGYAHVRDTAEINQILHSELAQRVLPSDLKLLWSAKPMNEENKNIYELYALKVTTTDGRAPLEGDVITDAKDTYDQFGKPDVSMTMNSDGAREWAALTKANVGKAVAIVLDGVVYSLRLRVLCGFSCLGHAYSDIVVFKQFYVLRADVLTASI
jgi:SecD/SecF fusion protein